MKVSELGKQALRDYRKVKYFPFSNDAAAPYILTSDPLGYLEAFIDSKLAAIQRDGKSQREKLKKGRYFTQLSKDFYISSLSAKMPAKGTLIYYSFINLVKVYLNLKGLDLETKTEYHGLSLPSKNTVKMKLAKQDGSGIFIFQAFAKYLGKEIDQKKGVEIDFNEVLKNLPEVHEISHALNLFPSSKRKFLPVDIVIRTNDRFNKLYYTLSYEKKFDKLMKVDNLEKGTCSKKISLLDIEDDGVRRYYTSVNKFTYKSGSNRSWKMCYPKIVSDINELNLVPMLTKDGIRFYLDLEPSRLHRLSSLLAFAFYIGTVARYRPSLNESVLKGEFQPVINEAIITCPSQFFYLMVSYITNQTCAIPKAKIE